MTKEGAIARKRSFVVRAEKGGQLLSLGGSSHGQELAQRQEREVEDVCSHCGALARVNIDGKDFCVSCFPERRGRALFSLWGFC